LTLTPAVSIAASANPFCVGSSVTFSATPTNGGSAATYAWFVNGTQNMSSVTNSFSASLANLDEVYCEMTSSLACASPSNATSATITMNENPVVTPTVMVVPSANPICSGDAVTFTVTATNGGTTPSYQWAINGTNAGANSNVFASAAAGLVAGDVVSCEMTSNASCANPVTASDSETISVKPAVQGTFTSQESAPGEVDFSATAITGAGTMTYSWDFGDGTALGTGVTTSHTYTVNDDYTVVLSVTDECGTVAKTALVDFITLSINKHSDNNSVKVYPNPSNGIFNVSTSANATVVVYNAIGSVITTLTTTNNKLTLDLSNQANGIYFVKVLTNAETVVKKVNISR
ncbi:MAG: PKD domain-containing protein, partial [Bacteroidota bacterium]|nr:PKD domain-containing protein [Bacteroidota bacterium]